MGGYDFTQVLIFEILFMYTFVRFQRILCVNVQLFKSAGSAILVAYHFI